MPMHIQKMNMRDMNLMKEQMGTSFTSDPGIHPFHHQTFEKQE